MKNNSTNKAKILITIAGPTAVGKTDLTLKVAKRYDAHIFSADSRQLYKELSIGTAKPSTEELDSVVHHFIDHISIQETYNVGKYEREIDAKLKEYFRTNDIGILSGGTGMYIKAVLEGLDDFPEVKLSTIQHFDELLSSQGIEVLQEMLKTKDPEYASTVDLYNSRRIIRALSVIETSGKPFSSFLSKNRIKALPFTPVKICLTRDREELYQRINQRVDQMMDSGLLEEVKSVKAHQHLRALQTVGYSELFRHLDGEIPLPEAVELIKRNSRRYAKRQMTWFRNQGTWAFFAADDLNAINNYIDSKIEELAKNR